MGKKSGKEKVGNGDWGVDEFAFGGDMVARDLLIRPDWRESGRTSHRQSFDIRDGGIGTYANDISQENTISLIF